MSRSAGRTQRGTIVRDTAEHFRQHECAPANVGRFRFNPVHHLPLRLVLLISILLTTATVQAEKYKDAPLQTEGASELKKVNEFLAPYSARAKASYPKAKARFEAGLPKGAKFFVSTRLYDKVNPNAYEQVFIRVRAATADAVRGFIASEPAGPVAFHAGDKIEVKDANVLDWTILTPGGEEEGNLCGKAMDAYREGAVVLIYECLPEKGGPFSDSVFAFALSGQQQDISEIVSDEIREAGRVEVARLLKGEMLPPNSLIGAQYLVREGRVTATVKKLFQMKDTDHGPTLVFPDGKEASTGASNSQR